MTAQNEKVKLRLAISKLEEDGSISPTPFNNFQPGASPLEITIGSGQIFKKVDDLLPTLEPGVPTKVQLSKVDAYGERTSEKIIEVSKNDIGTDSCVVGQKLQMEGENGEQHIGEVIELNDENVTVDFNHPLAGSSIQIELMVEA